MRNKKLLSANIAELLTKQVTHELKNYHLYKHFENYFSILGIKDLENYYKLRAAEEDKHHSLIANYLSEADCILIYDTVPKNIEQSLEIVSIVDPFLSTVKREIETTEMLYIIYEAAIKERDYMTASWLFDKLIKEQIEEENTSRMALTIIELEEGDIFNKAEQIKNLLA